MAIEKTWLAIPALALTQNGGKYGELFVSSTLSFKVKQRVFLKSNTVLSKQFEIKRINDDTSMELGAIGQGIKDRSDIQEFLIADSAMLYAIDQERPAIPPDAFERAVYEEEPTVAKRVVLVDTLGRKFSSVIGNDGKVRLATDTSLSINNLSVTIQEPTEPQIVTLNIPAGDTEYPFIIPAKSQNFTLKIRDSQAKFKIRAISGSLDYISYTYGNSYESPKIDVPIAKTLYIECSKPCKVEIFYWKLP